MTESEETLTWNQIQELIQSGELYKLVRSPEVAASYREFRAKLESQGWNLVSHILETRLHWEQSELQQLNTVKYPTDEDKADAIFRDKSTLKILKNDFPYNFESDVSHLLVWSKIYIPLYLPLGDNVPDLEYHKHMNPKVKSLVERLLHQMLSPLGLTEYVWFINYPRLQSIKTVSHIHVLIKSSDTKSVERLLTDESLIVPISWKKFLDQNSLSIIYKK